MNEKFVVVTGHPALTVYLIEQGVVPEGVHVIEHASADDVRGKNVVGMLPFHLAALAASVTVVTMNVPRELRGQELDIDEVRRYAGPINTYRVVVK